MENGWSSVVVPFWALSARPAVGVTRDRRTDSARSSTVARRREARQSGRCHLTHANVPLEAVEQRRVGQVRRPDVGGREARIPSEEPGFRVESGLGCLVRDLDLRPLAPAELVDRPALGRPRVDACNHPIWPPRSRNPGPAGEFSRRPAKRTNAQTRSTGRAIDLVTTSLPIWKSFRPFTSKALSLSAIWSIAAAAWLGARRLVPRAILGVSAHARIAGQTLAGRLEQRQDLRFVNVICAARLSTSADPDLRNRLAYLVVDMSREQARKGVVADLVRLDQPTRSARLIDFGSRRALVSKLS